MKILFTNIKMTPPFLLGGDSSLMHTLLIYLQEKGHECYTIGSFDPNIPIFPSWREAINDLKNRKIPHTLSSGLSVFTHKKWPFVIFKNNRSVSYEYKYPCRMVNKEIYPRELQAEIRKNMPDCILTQMDGAEIVLEISNSLQVPCIVLIVGATEEQKAYVKLVKASTKNYAIYASKAIQRYFSKILNTQSTVWYAGVDFGQYKTQRRKPEFITMINPVKVKGGEMFLSIVDSMPDQKFLTVFNWYEPYKDGIDVYGRKNLTIVPRTEYMRAIYEKTLLLLVPSFWLEAFPRVIFEAGINGIPVIASRRGGIPEALGNGGLLIDKYWNTDVWTRAINRLLRNKKLYNDISKKAIINAKKFTIEKQGKQFEDILRHVTHQTNAN